MAVNKQMKSINNGEIPLPEAIIQHIQSFLLSKEAAQTSLLSKSWYRAWSTRPDLEFRSFDFTSPAAFWESVEKGVQSHELFQNLRIQSFRLYGNLGDGALLLADDLIRRAIRMDPLVFAVELDYRSAAYSLPAEVLSSETLTSLSLVRCTVRSGRDDGQQVRCSKLESLSLRRTDIDACVLVDLIFGNMSSIEEMLLSNCFTFFVLGGQDFYPDNHLQQTINHFEFRKLRCLVLEEMRLLPSFFDNFAGNFPCLKDFSAHFCKVDEEIRIRSPSLERVTFIPKGSGVFRAQFDFPNLLKFTFSGRLPVLSFGNRASGREWESDISITTCRYFPNKWYLELRTFLADFSLSRISLSINFWDHVENFSPHHGRSNAEGVQGLTDLAMFEDRRVHQPFYISSTSLRGLFYFCKPEFIGYCLTPDNLYQDDCFRYLRILCESLVVGAVFRNSSDPVQHLLEVSVERFQNIRAEWQPMTMATLLDDLAIWGSKQKIRFRLKWK